MSVSGAELAAPVPPATLPDVTATATAPRPRRGRLIAAAVATAVLVVPLGWFWFASLVPETYSVMAMGGVDAGGAPIAHGHAGHGTAGWGVPAPQPGEISLVSLAGPADRAPDVSVTLTAESGRVVLDDGTTIDGFTLNGSTPGPTITATQGDLVEVTLVNASVPGGATLHWHGMDVPNAEDGVAGVTQDAVPIGGRHVYRFVAEDVGTYWYHSHQLSHRQVRLGLLGAVVVRPEGDAALEEEAGEADGVAGDEVVALVHTYGGTPTLNGSTAPLRHVTQPGSTTRVRVINSDNVLVRAWVAGGPYRLLAVDGQELTGPTPVDGESVQVPAGGRADLEVTAPADGSAALVRLGGELSVLVGPDGSAPPSGREAAMPSESLDLLAYGARADVALAAEPADRTFRYAIGRRMGFVDGRPGLHWTVNGRTFPDIPMFVVREGDVVRMTISNSSGQSHPMHLHGHHVLVLSRDGVSSTGSPWWTDSLEVRTGETYEVAFVADNPGVWMDHCHNLPHAQEGLIAHLAYEGVGSPFTVGGPEANAPE